ncbi:hypothetical protein AR438_10980 [Chryseobacterium aquaticum]|uniref:Uncharacterized protein n=1 Tax=Chryseobacterium aquaticum TaxID=452084 RepID=A0A0Q3LSE5_9FLAO|nr:hypothetical protein [Chryseobacterium aquaticum]KQK26097.1 hypothetical protein AR438_10980 [Chryseobacterium aquaticum]
MEYNFRDKNYKVSGFKTFLTNQLKKHPAETVYQFLIEFIHNNNFEDKDLMSILDRFIDYSKRTGEKSETIFAFVSSKLEQFPARTANESILPISKLLQQIDNNYALNFLERNLDNLQDNTKEKVQSLLFKVDLLIERKELDKAFAVLRDCLNQSYDLNIFDSLESKRTIYEKMSFIGDLESKSNVAIIYYIYYCAFQASLEFLHFPYLDTYRNFRLSYSIFDDPENEILKIIKHLTVCNLEINSFNSFLQDLYRFEIPKAFKLDTIDIDTFTISNASIKDLTFYSNFIGNLSVKELVSTIEFLSSQKIKTLVEEI